jgi:site-specific DNA recombinase
LDLHSRGGRLSADIQAVIAADYIRNLRPETKKGFYGRLKQGIYPLAAPAGYLDQGKGKAKALDPVTAPLVRRAFDLYARGNWGLVALSEEMRRLGFKTKRGGKMAKNKLSTILNNPFYIGLIRIKRTREMFRGAHEPLVSKALFDRVRLVLTGKHRLKIIKHDFIFRRLLTCAECRHALIGERQKGHVYYRCHSRECPTTGIREEAVEQRITEVLSPLFLTPAELEQIRGKMHALRENWDGERDREIRAVTLDSLETCVSGSID